MLVQQVHHVAYRCVDAKETVEWYGKHLDMNFVLAIAEDEVPSTGEPNPYMQRSRQREVRRRVNTSATCKFARRSAERVAILVDMPPHSSCSAGLVERGGTQSPVERLQPKPLQQAASRGGLLGDWPLQIRTRQGMMCWSGRPKNT
jgi:hypothetical protein